MVYTNYLWWFGGWFIIVIPTLIVLTFRHSHTYLVVVLPFSMACFFFPSKPVCLRIQYKKDLIKTVNSFKKDWMSGELKETATVRTLTSEEISCFSSLL